MRNNLLKLFLITLLIFTIPIAFSEDIGETYSSELAPLDESIIYEKSCDGFDPSECVSDVDNTSDDLPICQTLDCSFEDYCQNNKDEKIWAPTRTQCLINGNTPIAEPVINDINNNQDNKTITITLFYGDTCPHCHEFIKYLDKLIENDSRIKVESYEVYNNYTNQLLFKKWVNDYNVKSQGVPTYFINGKVWQGYSERMNKDIEEHIYNYLNKEESTNTDTKVDLPIIGEVDLTKASLPLITIVLGFLDGFNPCAFFVLLFLLSMLVYAKSRKRMLIIGGTFVFFSGLIYFLFMSAWLNFFLVTKEITLITTIAGIVALIIATIDIKDYFALNKGVSLSISKKNKTKLIKKMRSLMKADNMVSMMIGTIVLAITANMYELLCTAGFPMVFTKLLVTNNLASFSYYMYLVLYNIVYVVPLLVIVLIFTYTLGAKKLSDKQGEVLKLLSGNMMLFLGILLVFFPKMLNNLMSAVALIVLAIIVTFITIKVKKYYLNKKSEEKEETD